MAETILTISHPDGLHLRPAALFVQTAARFQSTIMFQNLDRPNARELDAKVMFSMLQAGVRRGHRIRVVADGPDAEQAITALADLVARNFVELA